MRELQPWVAERRMFMPALLQVDDALSLDLPALMRQMVSGGRALGPTFGHALPDCKCQQAQCAMHVLSCPPALQENPYL